MDKFAALTIYRRVVELNGFSAAAKDLGYSNAAVSKNVQELEAELGARLLNRTTRRVSTTEAGQIYYGQISTLLDNLEDADTLAADFSANPHGTLKVNAPMSMGLIRIAPVVSEFLDAYPEISVDLSMNDAVVDLIEGGFDIGVRGTSGLKDSSLIARKLADLPRTLCAAPGYIENAPPLGRPDELSHHDCLIYTLTDNPSRWTFSNSRTSVDVTVTGRLSINNSIALRDAALKGRSITLLPDFICGEALQSGSLIRMLPEWEAATQSIFAVYPAHREHSRKLRVFLDFLVDKFSDE